MGIMDRLENCRAYRWLWDRRAFRNRPLTHSARLIFGTRPGMAFYGAACFAAGCAVHRGPAGGFQDFMITYLFTLINGHLWV